jgi:nicotinamide-nucleotide amidase
MSVPLKAVVVAVGSEMLTPTRTDTNSLFVTEVLNGLGIDVAYKAIVGDDREELTDILSRALDRHRVLVLTGGLGPTDDDLTREVVASHLGLPLDEDPAIVESIRARFAARGLAMPEGNRRQAMVPRGARVLENPRGSAPGLLIEAGDRLIALLPGPPREMRPMMSGAVRDHLAALAGDHRLLRRALRITGRSESRVDEWVQPLYRAWLASQPRIDTTILASPGFVELHLSTQVADESAGASALDHAVGELADALGPDVVSTDGTSLEETLGTMLRARAWRIAFAESCTGGLATSRLTDVPGSSDYVDRSWVVYSNDAKRDLLGVPEAMLAQHGAVSEPVATALAEGALARAPAQVAVAITGIAGPGGGSEAKPVGMVWIAVALSEPRETRAALCRFLGGRDMVKTFAAVTALDLVRRRMLGAPWDIDWIWRRATDATDGTDRSA